MKRPRNLLRKGWSIEEISTVLRETPHRPLLPAFDSTIWPRRNARVTTLFAPLLRRARAEAKTPLPALTPELYASTAKTGSRQEFESVYFERRRRLARTAIALILRAPRHPARDVLGQSLITKLTDIAGEPAWALPAHVSNPSGLDPLRIDLFHAETANLMGEMIDLFGAFLPPDLIKHIRSRLYRETFENYLTRWSKMEWPTAGMNWNAVCHQGVIGAALSQVEDPHYLAQMLALAGKFLPHFLKGFASDGGSSEGPSYWEYGFGRLAALNEQLEARSDGKLSFFEGDDFVRAIARFGPLMQLPNQKFVNYSDGPAEGILRPTTLRYLGQRLADPLARQLGVANYRHLLETSLDLDALRTDTFYMTRLLLSWPSDRELAHSHDPVEDKFFPKLGVLVAHGRDHRGHHWDFAAKGGNNHEHHNHNDCGSYLVNVDGQRLIIEIGAPLYVTDYFGPNRYTFLASRSLGHSLPIINGVEQSAGKNFNSRILRHALTAKHAELQIDLTACYPKEAACQRLVRTLRFDKVRGRVDVTDAFVLREAKSIESAIITNRSVRLMPDKIILEGDALALALEPRAGTVIDRIDQRSYLEHRTGKTIPIHRIVWAPSQLTKRGAIEYSIVLT